MPRLLGAANVKFTVFIVLWWHRLALSDQLVTVEGKKRTQVSNVNCKCEADATTPQPFAASCKLSKFPLFA